MHSMHYWRFVLSCFLNIPAYRGPMTQILYTTGDSNRGHLSVQNITHLSKQEGCCTSYTGVFSWQILLGQRFITWSLVILYKIMLRGRSIIYSSKKVSFMTKFKIKRFYMAIYDVFFVRGQSMGLFTRERITFRKTYRNVIRPFPDFTLCERKALSNQAFETRFETRKKGAFWIVIHVKKAWS